MMDALRQLGDEAKEQMLNEQKRHAAAMEALQDLSSKNLTDLISQESPDNDVVAVMNSVLILLGKPVGWKEAQQAVMGQNFMYNVGNMEYKDPTEKMINDVESYLT